MIVASAVTESILEQTGKHSVNVFGQPIGLAETELNSTAVTDCITTVYLLWGHILLLASCPGLVFITTNCLPSFRHFGHGLTYFPTPYQDLLQRAFPNTTSFQCSVLSSCFPFLHPMPFLPMVWVVPGVKWHKQVSSGLRVAEPNRKQWWQLSLWGQTCIKKCWQSGKAVP